MLIERVNIQTVVEGMRVIDSVQITSWDLHKYLIGDFHMLWSIASELLVLAKQ